MNKGIRLFFEEIHREGLDIDSALNQMGYTITEHENKRKYQKKYVKNMQNVYNEFLSHKISTQRHHGEKGGEEHKTV